MIKRECGRVLLMLEQKQDERLRDTESVETASVTLGWTDIWGLLHQLVR